jgi:hypothetical protein
MFLNAPRGRCLKKMFCSETCDALTHKKATDKVHLAKKEEAQRANSKKNLVYTGFGRV